MRVGRVVGGHTLVERRRGLLHRRELSTELVEHMVGEPGADLADQDELSALVAQ